MYACATISVYVFIVDRYSGHFLFGVVTKNDYKNLFYVSWCSDIQVSVGYIHGVDLLSHRVYIKTAKQFPKYL